MVTSGPPSWRIFCQTRSGPKTTLVNKYSADTGDTISLNKSILDTSGSTGSACLMLLGRRPARSVAKKFFRPLPEPKI